MEDEQKGAGSPAQDPKGRLPSPLHRINRPRETDDADARDRIMARAAQAGNRRYWVRLNVSPLGWVALVEQSQTGATSALGDVLDLEGGGCVVVLSSAPTDLLGEHREVTISVRPSPDQQVTCVGQVLDWKETPSGIQVRIGFDSSDPEVQKQLSAVANATRGRLLQISHGEE
jgi:hypothetical protein